MSARYTPPFSVTQQKVLAFVPKVTSSLSGMGALYICQDILRMPRSKRTPYHRLVGVMSLMDAVFAGKSWVSTWPIPQETPFVWGARGTTETCNVAGFLGHGASLTSILYNGSLAWYFYLTIVQEYRHEHIQSTWYLEPAMHALPWLVGWSTAAALWPLEYYNPIGWTCWIGSYPPGCSDTTYPCTRGATQVDAYRWAFFHAQAWFVFAVAGITLGAIYLTVRKREAVMEQYAFAHRSSSLRGPRTTPQPSTLAQRVAIQACLYQFFFFLTWVFPMMQFVVSSKTGHLFFPLLTLTVIFTPLQGFLDAIIYIRPRYLKYRQAQRQRRQTSRPRVPVAPDDDVPIDEQDDHRTSPPRDSWQERQDAWNNIRSAIIQAISLNPHNDFRGEIYDPHDGNTTIDST